MKSSKKFVLVIFPVLLISFAAAQSIKVKKGSAEVKGVKMEGYEVTLEGTSSEIEASLQGFLKTVGKIRIKDNVITIPEPSIKGTSYPTPVFALTRKEDEKNSTAWIGISAADWSDDDLKQVTKEIEKMTYEFGVKFNQDKIQVQIDESLRASTAVEKQQQKLVNQNKELNVKLEDNQREKVRLEQSLEVNKQEYESLLKKIEKNKHDQDSVMLAGEQIRKVTDMHRDRQKKVN